MDRYYDAHLRDPEARKFYGSAAWQRARKTKLANDPVCQRCQVTWARHCHHVIPLDRCTPFERVSQSNLLSLCQPCHNEIEAEAKGAG
jgi:5-methylcytosine-specific restriction enzyme A